MDDADEVEEVLEGYNGEHGSGDNLRSEPYSSSSSSSSGNSTSSNSEPEAFLVDLVDMQGGEMPLDQVDKMLNDVRDYGVDVDELVTEAGFDVDDGTVVDPS
jgi:hypothetical protein